MMTMMTAMMMTMTRSEDAANRSIVKLAQTWATLSTPPRIPAKLQVSKARDLEHPVSTGIASGTPPESACYIRQVSF
jgi:hypothetical protein